MHVGTPSSIYSPFPGFIAHRLGRQRKVKCNQLPGQPKVCPSFSPRHTNRFFLFISAKYATPFPSFPPTHSHSHIKHCMVKNYPCTSVLRVFSPLVAESTDACLDTMPSKLQAKRSASRLSVDVLARTPQTHNIGLCFSLPPPACSDLICVKCDSLLILVLPPLRSRSYSHSRSRHDSD